jgi:hypothetical protein
MRGQSGWVAMFGDVQGLRGGIPQSLLRLWFTPARQNSAKNFWFGFCLGTPVA